MAKADMTESMGVETDSLNYHIQRTTLPGMRETPVQGFITNHPLRVPGETIEYDPLSVDFIVDEYYDNVLYLQDWLIESKSKEKKLSDRLRDLKLQMYDRNGKPSIEFTFFGAHPVEIGTITLDSTLNDIEVITCNVVFEYQFYRKTLCQRKLNH